jgi:uncharacterized paraquat-inducible protein A
MLGKLCSQTPKRIVKIENKDVRLLTGIEESIHFSVNYGFTQKRSLFDKGIVICNECAKLQPNDNKHCVSCKSELFLIFRENIKQTIPPFRRFKPF